jgi:hypothetical protein
LKKRDGVKETEENGRKRGERDGMYMMIEID